MLGALVAGVGVTGLIYLLRIFFDILKLTQLTLYAQLLPVCFLSKPITWVVVL